MNSRLIRLHGWALIPLSVGICACAAVAPAKTPSSEHDARAAKLQQYLDRQASEHGFSGAVLVADGEHILLAKGYGYADRAQRAPNTVRTRFRIASITKSFTAIVALQLAQRGAPKLTDPICRHLEACPVGWTSITIAHLLSHTSGVPPHKADETYDSVIQLAPAALIAHLGPEALRFRPGTQFEYSSVGYVILGSVLERATGRSYRELVRELIIQPLGLRDTGYDAPEAQIPNHASGYRQCISDGSIARPVALLDRYASGGLYSSVEDLYKLMQALAGGQLLSADMRMAMWSRAQLPSTDQRPPYGYGWWLFPEGAEIRRPLIRGMGGNDGFVGELSYFPADVLTVVVLQNCSVGNPVGVGTNLARVALGDK